MSNKPGEIPPVAETHPIKPMVSKPETFLKPREGRGFSLKEIQSAAVPLDDAKKLPITIDFRRNSLHDKNVEILSTLYRQIVSKRKEDEIKIDVTLKEAFRELKQLKGIKKAEAKLLIDAGVKSLAALVEEEASSLADDTKIELDKIEKWIELAKQLVKKKGITEALEGLLQIKGMNRTYAEKLVNFGILTLEDLCKEDATILSQDLKISDNVISIWIEDALRLTGKPAPSKKQKAKAKKERVIEEPSEKLEEKPVEVPAEKLEEKPVEKPAKKPKEKVKEEVKEEKKATPTIKDIPGIGKGDLKELKDLGITTIEQLIKEDATEVASITGLEQATIQRWMADARQLIGAPSEPVKPKEEILPTEVKIEDPLTELLKITGMGKKTAEKLIKAGIKNSTELINADVKDLAKKSKISEKDLKKLVEYTKKISE